MNVGKPYISLRDAENEPSLTLGYPSLVDKDVMSHKDGNILWKAP